MSSSTFSKHLFRIPQIHAKVMVDRRWSVPLLANRVITIKQESLHGESVRITIKLTIAKVTFLCRSTGCGEVGVPGVYVNVAKFRNWIDEQVAGRGLQSQSYII